MRPCPHPKNCICFNWKILPKWNRPKIGPASSSWVPYSRDRTFRGPEGGKKHHHFAEVKHIKLDLLTRDVQLTSKSQVQSTPIRRTIETRIVDNETLGYFLAWIQLFLEKIGVNKTELRFRQQMQNEMAYYATDCWDVELLTSYCWIECVGCWSKCTIYQYALSEQALP